MDFEEDLFDSMNIHKRLLQSVMSDSKSCKNDCIEAGKNFCPRSDHRSGFCCEMMASCTKVDVCSKDVSD